MHKKRCLCNKSNHEISGAGNFLSLLLPLINMEKGSKEGDQVGQSYSFRDLLGAHF